MTSFHSNDFNDNRDRSGSRAFRTPVPASDFADFLDKTGAALVGVTGRRHVVPAAIPAVESAARTALRALVAASDGRPIYVATGLAIGADQLAAKLVLEAKAEAAARNATSPLRLVALLPMSVAEYRRDFSTKPGTGETTSASEISDFDRYLASADVVVEIEATSENVERARRGEPLDRTAQYAALGDFLVERSRLLWAFWSGDASNVKRGGTADVVLRKSRRLPSENLGDASESADFIVLNDFAERDASSDFSVGASLDVGASDDFSFGNPFEIDLSNVFSSARSLAATGATDFFLSSAASVPARSVVEGGFGFEAVCCVATPEVLRFKNPDGTKTRVPESTENAGKIAFWARRSDAAPRFEDAKVASQTLTLFWKTFCEQTR